MKRTSHPSSQPVMEPEKKKRSIFSFLRRVSIFMIDNIKNDKNEPKDVVVSGVVEVYDILMNDQRFIKEKTVLPSLYWIVLLMRVI